MNKVTIILNTFELHAFTPASVSFDLTRSLPAQPFFITRQPVLKIISEHLQSVPEILFVHEQTSLMVRTTHRNLYLIRTILVCVKDNKQGELINMDQSKLFDRFDHWHQTTVLQAAGIKPGFQRWISLLVAPPVLVKSRIVRVASYFTVWNWRLSLCDEKNIFRFIYVTE